jgi:formylglycine-generating enzyme required for sulfatase activity
MKINKGSYRVYRGGSWYYSEFFCEVSLVRYSLPNDHGYNFGFRTVRRCGDDNK